MVVVDARNPGSNATIGTEWEVSAFPGNTHTHLGVI